MLLLVFWVHQKRGARESCALISEMFYNEWVLFISPLSNALKTDYLMLLFFLKMQFSKRQLGNAPNVWRKVLWSEEIKFELLAIMKATMSKSAPLIIPRTPYP